MYVDSAALRTSASAAALRAAAPGALRAAAAVSSPGRVGGGGDGGKKKRKILRFVPVLPRLLDRRRDARAKRQQKQQQEQQQQQWELHVGNESGRSRQQQAQLQQPPRAAATATPVFGEQLPASEADDLGGEGRDAALPFGAALRSADDVPMSLVVRSRFVPFSFFVLSLSLSLSRARARARERERERERERKSLQQTKNVKKTHSSSSLLVSFIPSLSST